MSKPLASSTGIATGLVVPLAMAAPGNLDAGFADHGRIVLSGDFGSRAWAVEALDDGSALVAGGFAGELCGYYWGYYCYYDAANFAAELTITGEIDPSFAAARPDDIEVRDAIRLPDGKTLLAGIRVNGLSPDFNTLVAYRLEADGSLDSTFGSLGIFELPQDLVPASHDASSIVQDPDGRIVVSGSRGENLLVLRLLPDGTLDASFGEEGVFIGPPHEYMARTAVARTSVGGYRVMTTGESQCRVVGLTDAGAMDAAFGTAGIAAVEATAGEADRCHSMASQADGNLLLSGAMGSQGFATRMLVTGEPDPVFSADAVATAMTEATAIAVDDGGRILVAGSGEPGAMVMRLAPGGALDASFGEAGATLIDLASEFGSAPQIHALDVRPDGRVMAAGGEPYSRQPFVVQLHGEGGIDSPGILGFSGPSVEVAEGTDVVFKVRRTGGKSGSVSVQYTTVPNNAWNPAPIPGEDYSEVTGTLTWGDGDASEREIVVPVLADAGSSEEHEEFWIALSNPVGGAGLGKKNGLVSILADGAPAGQFAIYNSVGTEESTPAQVWVYRNFYDQGAVSVTVTPLANSATAGEDFDATPITLTWADGDTEPKIASIPIVDDDDAESTEYFTVELTNPTGGAVVGPYATGGITIGVSDQRAANRGGGGGSTGWLSVLLLGLAALFRSLRASRPCRQG
jgi:uncharacterized delta-60 repeat protein